MMRTLVQYDGDNLVVIREVQCRPNGNAKQRAQQLRSGFHLQWRKAERYIIGKSKVGLADLIPGFEGFDTEEGCTIYNENEHVAMLGRDLAQQAVDAAIKFESEFSISEQTPPDCPCCGLRRPWGLDLTTE